MSFEINTDHILARHKPQFRLQNQYGRSSPHRKHRDYTAEEIEELYAKHGTTTKAARAIKMPLSTLSKLVTDSLTLSEARRRGQERWKETQNK